MPWRENKGVANLNGIYTDIFGLRERKKSWRKSSLRCCFARNESSDHRNLDGIYTEFLSTEHTLSNHRNLNGCFFGFFARFDIQATTG